MSDRAWTLLLTGPEHGVVGGPGVRFDKSPAHYERVTVIERDPALARIEELEAENLKRIKHIAELQELLFTEPELKARIAELEGHFDAAEQHVKILRDSVATLDAENRRLLRHLNRMNDIMCDALAGTALLGGGEK